MGKLKMTFDFSQVETLEDLKWVVSTLTGMVEIETSDFNKLGGKKKFFTLVEEAPVVEENGKVENLPVN